jgi:hypothetical protein
VSLCKLFVRQPSLYTTGWNFTVANYRYVTLFSHRQTRCCFRQHSIQQNHTITHYMPHVDKHPLTADELCNELRPISRLCPEMFSQIFFFLFVVSPLAHTGLFRCSLSAGYSSSKIDISFHLLVVYLCSWACLMKRENIIWYLPENHTFVNPMAVSSTCWNKSTLISRIRCGDLSPLLGFGGLSSWFHEIVCESYAWMVFTAVVSMTEGTTIARY